MDDNTLIQKPCKCSIINCEDIGAISFAKAINKFEKPVISELIHFKRMNQEAQASETRTTEKTPDSAGNEVNGNEQITAQLRRSDAVKNHLSWIRNKEVKPWNERGVWAPSGSKSDSKIEDISWGQTSASPSLPTHELLPELVFYDETHSRAFEQAHEIQDQQGSSNLSYTELDVRGNDAHGNRLRVQRACEVKLAITSESTEQGDIEKTTMELKQILTISTLEAPSTPKTKPHANYLYKDIVKQLAQHEVDKALDERNHYLREIFKQDVDHIRITRQSTIGAHDWSFKKPEVCVRGTEGTMMKLTETRSDLANGEEVILIHTIEIEQSKCEDGKDHLFDLPTQGGESERQIRQARWTISSATDKCIAAGGGDRASSHRGVHDSCLP